ncbi:hypothetical protein GRZ55_21425 [Chelativorans sp. ZYF759]|uniref:hypothetical protein n=1 Tax=Chelativorans sp. ZYF759 TaxID=2692213 RepID=UPI00145E82ED|nr:hypothetical protein [Chelativorans sp. ZYF759]NMG41800.1 hypothetical protein [Chelativorans sp. ZYF759]
MDVEYSELGFRDWLATRPFVILANEKVLPKPTLADVSPAILEYLQGRRPDFLVADPDHLFDRGIVLSHDHMERFRSGEPILMAFGADAVPLPLKRGRRQLKALEKLIQDALAIQVYLKTERICALMRVSNETSRRMKVPALRDAALELLVANAWIDDGRRSNDAEERALAFFRTQYDAGSRLVGAFFADNPSPREAGKREGQQVLWDCAGPDARKIAAEGIDHEVERIRFLLSCLRQATTLVNAIQEQADDSRRDRPAMKATVRTIAGAGVERPSLAQVVRAAVDCDVDLTGLFPNLLVHRELVALARSLGRFGRGYDVRLDASQFVIMEKLFRIGLEYLGRAQAAGEFYDRDAVAILMARMMLEIRDAEVWHRILDEAVALNSAITFSR